MNISSSILERVYKTKDGTVWTTGQYFAIGSLRTRTGKEPENWIRRKGRLRILEWRKNEALHKESCTNTSPWVKIDGNDVSPASTRYQVKKSTEEGSHHYTLHNMRLCICASRGLKALQSKEKGASLDKWTPKEHFTTGNFSIDHDVSCLCNMHSGASYWSHSRQAFSKHLLL